jgi:uncharacterized protein (TIGR03118 family)
MPHAFRWSNKRLARSARGWRIGALALAATGAAAIPVVADAGSTSHYRQANLISDIPGVARITDANLVNPWGMAASPSSPLWIADNGTGVSTLYTGGVNGSIPQIVPLVVSIPEGAPTGVVFNPTGDFVITNDHKSAAANFIFDSEAGRLTAWSKAVSGTTAQVEFSDPSAVYKGLAVGKRDGASYLFATNFHGNRIDVFNSKFVKVGSPGGFTDPGIPAGYAPFGIQSLNGNLYVTYAEQDAAKHDDVKGAGHGFVDVYDTAGHLLGRLITRGALNSPWGLVIAPAEFGAFSGDLLVGNFGDGAINAYDPRTGDFKGALVNTDGNPIAIDSLWGLRFGNGTTGTTHTLMFTAGIGAEGHGLFGEITLAK